MIEQAIIDSLKSFMGDDWTPQLHEAWTDTLEQVVDIMLQGADMTLPNRDGETKPGTKPATLISGWLEPELMELVEESFSEIKADKQAFTKSFYNTLFDQHPQLRPLFANIDMVKQGSKLYATLVLLVENLRHPVELERVLLPLGNKHRGYGATAEHYPMVSSAILQTLEKYLGDQWKPEIAAAWAETCRRVEEMMLRGAREEIAIAKGVDTKVDNEHTVGKTPKGSEPQSGITPMGSSAKGSQSLAAQFARWFYGTSLSTIIAIWAAIGITLISLSFAFPSIRGIVVFANPLSLLLALFLFIRETPERKKQFHYHAWSIIDNATHVKTSRARFLALQDLCADGVSLQGLPLNGADLVGINLMAADLASASMKECNLSDAVLDGADLNYVNLENSNLSGAKLVGANLSFAKLCAANCSSAELSHANLLFADLSNANLSGANLQNAKISGAKFAGAYLGGANLQGTDVRREELEGAFLVGATLPDGTVES
jgi:uncharacterized protein YjbI with pentapeptide repeats/hemoglobin-like flavoprotein